MALTYEPISTTTLGTATASVTFSSIPQRYTDLILVVTARQATVNTTDMGMQVNSNGSITASWSAINGNGSSATSTRSSNPFGYFYLGDSAPSNAASGIFSVTTVHIMNYANTTLNKTVLARSSQDLSGSGNVRVAAGLFPTTAAITSTTVGGSAGSDLATGCTFTLYGIKAA